MWTAQQYVDVMHKGWGGGEPARHLPLPWVFKYSKLTKEANHQILIPKNYKY
jgi:hypothetical protein